MHYASLVTRLAPARADASGDPPDDPWEVHERALSRRAAGEDVTLLSIGQEADERTADEVVEAAVASLRDGRHHYADVRGEAPLRESIARYHERLVGERVDADPDGRGLDPTDRETCEQLTDAALDHGRAVETRQETDAQRDVGGVGGSGERGVLVEHGTVAQRALLEPTAPVDLRGAGQLGGARAEGKRRQRRGERDRHEERASRPAERPARPLRLVFHRLWIPASESAV